MVNQRRDASVRVELGMLGGPVLVFREVDINRVIGEVELLEDDRDLPISVSGQYAKCPSVRRCSPSVRGRLMRVEGKVLLLGHGGAECTVEDAWVVGGCGRTEELPLHVSFYTSLHER